MAKGYICQVCGKENVTLLCGGCGFDGSQEYLKYPTLQRIPQKEKTGITESSTLRTKEISTEQQLISSGYSRLSVELWDKAAEDFDKALRISSNPRAYVGRMMATMHIKKESDIPETKYDIETNPDWINALKCATGSYKDKLQRYTRERSKNVVAKGKTQIKEMIVPNPPPPPPENLDVYTEVTFSHENHPAGKMIAVPVNGKNISVSIPVNITDGQIVPVKGKGNHSMVTGACGDLYVTIRITPPLPPQKWKYLVAALAAVLIGIGISLFTTQSPSPAEDFPKSTEQPVSNTIPEPTDPSISVTMPESTNPPTKEESRFSNVYVGDTVYFGSYEQDNNNGNGDERIEWVVIDKQNGKALLMSKYALDSRPYHSSSRNVTWEKCSLRQWLNGSFLNSAFSSDEQSYILTTAVSADKNPDYPEISPGFSTQDKIYILSVNEALYYFPDYQDRACTATKYTQSKGVVKCWWWLRTPGESQDTAASINSNGSWDETGSDVAGSKGSVRPVLWVKTD